MPPVFLLGAGGAAGVIGTLVGAGGGFILVPALALLDSGLSPATVTAMSLAAIVFNATSGTFAYWRQSRIDIGSAVPFALASMPGSVAGALVTRALARGAFDIAFGTLLVVLAVFLVLRRPAPRSVPPLPPRRGAFDRVLRDGAGNEYRYRVDLPAGLAISLGEGFVASLFGVGGGVLMVPILIGVLRFPPHIATATSTCIVLITSATATVTHLSGPELSGHLGHVLLLGAGALAGAQAGAWLSRRVGGVAIVRVLAGALALAGVRLALPELLAFAVRA